MIIAPHLQVHAKNSKHAAAGDQDLVKWGGVKGFVAQLCQQALPNPGRGLSIRQSPDGPIWDAPSASRPFDLRADGTFVPGVVGGLMPTLDGTPLDDPAPERVSLSASAGWFFKITFTITTEAGFLSGRTLDSVEIVSASAAPTDTASVKHLQFNSTPAPEGGGSFFNSSINVDLCDVGSGLTALQYNT